MHITSVNMSAPPQCPVEDKEQFVITEIILLLKKPQVSTSEYWWANCDETLKKNPPGVAVKFGKCKNAHIAVQLQHNDRFSNCVLLYWLYKLYCIGRLEEVHRGNGCSYTICTEMVLHYHCLLCSTAINSCSTGATVALSAVQYRDRLLFYRCYSGTVCCAVQR